MTENFPDTVIIGSSALYPLAKGAIQMLIIIIITIIFINEKNKNTHFVIFENMSNYQLSVEKTA